MVKTSYRIKSDLFNNFYLEGQLEKSEPLSFQEERDLFARAKAGDIEARNKLIRSNLRFVVSIARQYLRYWRGPIAELVSEGNMGLLEAVKRFDSSKGFKFITYAVWWIRQSILKAMVQNSRVSRIPTSRAHDLKMLEKTTQRFISEHEREPSISEIIELTGLSEIRFENALAISRNDVSIDAEESFSFLLRVLVSKNIDQDDELAEKEIRDNIESLLGCLDYRERIVVSDYFGIGGNEPVTLKIIGKRLGITRERVRQIRERGMWKIRVELGKRHLKKELEERDYQEDVVVDETAAKLLREKHEIFRRRKDLESLREQQAIARERSRQVQVKTEIEFSKR